MTVFQNVSVVMLTFDVRPLVYFIKPHGHTLTTIFHNQMPENAIVRSRAFFQGVPSIVGDDALIRHGFAVPPSPREL